MMMVKNYIADNKTSVVSTFNDLIFFCDQDGIIQDLRENGMAEWLLMPGDKAVGRHQSEVLPAEASQRLNEALDKVRNCKRSISFDYKLYVNGKATWFTVDITPLPDFAGRETKFICVVRDITGRKEKELILHGLLENAFNSFIVLREIRDQENLITDFSWLMMNRKAEKFVGKTFDELRDTTVRDVFDQEWLLFNEYVDVAATGTPLDLEYSIFKDNAKAWLHTHVSKLGDCLIVTIENITQKKLALKATADRPVLSRQAMDLFFSQALSGFYVMMLDNPMQWNDSIDKEAALVYAIEHLRFTRVNQALLEQYGATEEEFLKLTVKDFFGNDLDHARQLLRRLYDQGRLMMNRVSKRMDGSDLFLEGNYFCFTDENNRILGHFGIQQDVTERNHAEERLRASEERYRLLANNMLDLVALHEPDGTYTYLSPSVTKILGYTPEELVGTNPYPLFHPDDIPVIQEQSHRQAKEGREIANIEYRIRRKDGEYIWFSTNTKPIASADGEVIMLQTVSRDVTERVQTLHLLEERNREKNKLFSIIAHDLRGPLAGCIGLLNLTNSASSETDLQKYIRLARKSAFNLHELMDDLLMWAGSQLDKISFDPAIVDVTDEIEKVCRRFADIATGKGIALIVDIPDDSLCVFADRDMLHTITRNLLSNAIKFTPPGGKVTVQAAPKDDYIEISVQDTGVGISQNDVAKLFSKNSTFTTYGTGGEKGTGLGLGICKDFVDKHKGKIWVDSIVGQGSKFSFALRGC